MNREEVAKAYRNLGVAFLQAAEVLEGATIEEPPVEAVLKELQEHRGEWLEGYRTRAPELQPLPPLRQAAPTSQGVELSAPLCPVHNVEMAPSKLPGMDWYCKRTGGDPAWTNGRGYCTLNSQNLGTYRAIHQQAQQR